MDEYAGLIGRYVQLWAATEKFLKRIQEKITKKHVGNILLPTAL